MNNRFVWMYSLGRLVDSSLRQRWVSSVCICVCVGGYMCVVRMCEYVLCECGCVYGVCVNYKVKMRCMYM